MGTTITAWYLNTDRIYQLLGTAKLQEAADLLSKQSNNMPILSGEGRARAVIKEELERWLFRSNVPTLCELLTKKASIASGQRFTIYYDFYGKGLSKYGAYPQSSFPNNAMAELHNILRFQDNKVRLRVQYSPFGLCNNTAWSRLAGHTSLFVFGYIERANETEILARPYIIGDLHDDGLQSEYTPWSYSTYGEILLSGIESFQKIQEVYKSERSTPNLDNLKQVQEAEIKHAFAEILHEGFVPKDWGGEKSDLFTANLTYEGRKRTAAFIFKGPSKFKEMQVADLGKNGDQIDRLFTEPAQFCILQHCHKVSTAVGSTMKAYASRINDLRYFTVIDGYDTIRLFQAYHKCGFY